jgi:hypothetical protein
VAQQAGGGVPADAGIGDGTRGSEGSEKVRNLQIMIMGIGIALYIAEVFGLE